MGRQGLEVDLADIDAGQHGRRQFLETTGRSQQVGFGAGRIVQEHALGGAAGVGDGLLVEHLGARCTTDLWQLAGNGTGLGQGQGLRGLQDRHDLALGDRQGQIIRPLRLVSKFHRHSAAGVRDERHDRAHRALVGQATAGLEEAGQRLVVKAHGKRDWRCDADFWRFRVATTGIGDGETRDHSVGHSGSGSRRGAACGRLNHHGGHLGITTPPLAGHRCDGGDRPTTHRRRGCGAGFGVGAAEQPVIALAILKSERVVGLRSSDIGSGIRGGGDFLIQDLPVLIERQRQCEERPGRLDFRSGNGVVAPWILKGFPQHLIDIHARALVGGGGVGQQDEGLRGGAVVV